jgi:ATP phosphoribosyltransferase
MLTLALNKGRILDEVLPLLETAGLDPLEDPRRSRKLIFETRHPGLRLFVVRSGDVPTCVAHGAADWGITGKDTLLEHGGEGYYEPLDLGLSRCRLMTAGDPAFTPRPGQRLRVATKFVKVAQRYFSAQGQQIEVIPLGGAMELAPLIGLADLIVDIVDTGNTLRANGLAPLELIENISARVIVNKASMKQHRAELRPMLDALAAALPAAPEKETGA